MVQAAGPVDGDVGGAVVQPRGAVHRAAGRDAAEVEEAVEDGAVRPAVQPEAGRRRRQPELLAQVDAWASGFPGYRSNMIRRDLF